MWTALPLEPGFRVEGLGLPRPPPNYFLIYPKYPLLRSIKALSKGSWGGGGPGRDGGSGIQV